MQQSVRSVCEKFEVDCLSRFRTGAGHVLTTQKRFFSEIPLTMKIQHQIPFILPDQIIICQISFGNLWRQTNLFSSEKVNIWTPSRYFPFLFHFFVEMKRTRILQQKNTGERWKIVKPIT